MLDPEECSDHTPLMLAAQDGDLARIKTLLAAGANNDIRLGNARPFDPPYPPLYQAVWCCKRDAAMLLATDMSTDLERIERHLHLLFNFGYCPYKRWGGLGGVPVNVPGLLDPARLARRQLAEDVAIRLVTAHAPLQEITEECFLYWLNRASLAGMYGLVTHVLQMFGSLCPLSDGYNLLTCMWSLIGNLTHEQPSPSNDTPCQTALFSLLSLMPPSHPLISLPIKNGMIPTAQLLRFFSDKFPSLMAEDANEGFQRALRHMFSFSFSRRMTGTISGALNDNPESSLQLMRAWLEEGATVVTPAVVGKDPVQTLDTDTDRLDSPELDHPLSFVLDILLGEHGRCEVRSLIMIALWLFYDGAWHERQSNGALFSHIADHIPSLSQVVQSAPRLQHICTRTIRQHLPRPFRFSAKHLPLPSRLQNYITCAYLDVHDNFVDVLTEEVIANPSLPLSDFPKQTQ